MIHAALLTMTRLDWIRMPSELHPPPSSAKLPPMQTVCAFGCFDTEGARSWVIRKGLTDAGYTIAFCNTTARGFVGKKRDLTRRWRNLADVGQRYLCPTENDARTNVGQEYSCPTAMYAVFPSHFLMPLAWRLARKKKIPIIFDAFLSLYDTEVHDRRRISAWNPKAWLLKCMDWLACKLADVILLDTEEHKAYFVRHYHVCLLYTSPSPRDS